MGKSENGPDMRDCSTYAQEIQRDQQCHITVLLSTGIGSEAARWRITLLATDDKPSLSGPMWSVGTDTFFPHRDHKTFEGALFFGLAQLDGQIARAHFQEVIGIT